MVEVAKVHEEAAPLGSDAWLIRTAEAMGLESALRPRRRARKMESKRVRKRDPQE